ncbi:MAG: hypothetical protein R2727_09380 [Bacteroidales bacterium]
MEELYSTIDLTGTISDQINGYGTVWLGLPTNDTPERFARWSSPCESSATIVQFLSYEGSFNAVGGDADGITSTDIGVAEEGTATVGTSMQLQGTGTEYTDFTWTTE